MSGHQTTFTDTEPEGTGPASHDLAAASPRTSPIRRIFQIVLPVAISAALVVWIYRRIDDPAEVWHQMQQAAWIPLGMMIPLSLASHLLRAWRWRRFIGEPVSLFYGFTSIMIGYAVNDVLPRVGEVARVVNMNRMTKVPIARLLATLAAERFLDVIALVFFLGISFCLAGDEISRHFPRLAQAGPMALIFAASGLAGLFALACFSELLCRIFRKITDPLNTKLAEKGEHFLRQGAEGLAFLKKPSQAVPVLLETTGIWALYWICFILGIQAFGILDIIGWAGGTVSFSITVAGVLVPTVGAIGSYHEFGLQSLTKLYNLEPAMALACITVIHALLFYLVGGIFGALAWGLQIKVRSRRTAAGTEDRS
ncbi:MAG: flippase-like domain-containing protein [Planctomycetes bacterium]|nr:flippase-like domain-containing protein [Planctomycetota bacterium]